MSSTRGRNGLIYADSKEDIRAVVLGLLDESQRDYIVDRRNFARYSLAVLINATPINGDRCGAEFEAITHDISVGGLSFVSNAPVDEPSLLLRFPGFNQPPVILEVLRQTQIGPFWMIAGKFRSGF